MNEKHKEWSHGLYSGGPGEIITQKEAPELAIKEMYLLEALGRGPTCAVIKEQKRRHVKGTANI